jgi:adenosylcobinamide kinase/adenosylcobinamide-phosphate guanylyltransferase
MNTPTVAKSEFILGGQKSGKSRRAEMLARTWLDQSATHRAVLIATAQPWDDEMRRRIARHQCDRAERVPGMATVEEPLALADAIALHSQPDTILVVDCLTLWLTNLLMPAETDAIKRNEPLALVEYAYSAPLLIAIQNTASPVVLVGNEIGMGVIPMGRDVRAFVDALGRLNQDIAAVCQRVTLMAAGLPLHLKDLPCCV